MSELDLRKHLLYLIDCTQETLSKCDPYIADRHNEQILSVEDASEINTAYCNVQDALNILTNKLKYKKVL